MLPSENYVMIHGLLIQPLTTNLKGVNMRIEQHFHRIHTHQHQNKLIVTHKQFESDVYQNKDVVVGDIIKTINGKTVKTLKDIPILNKTAELRIRLMSNVELIYPRRDV